MTVKTCTVIIFLGMFYVISGMGQKIWSPPDKAFSIEVPVDLEKMSDYGAESYGGEISGYAFQIVISDIPEPRRNLPLYKKFGGLHFLVGGDDDQDFTEKYLKIDGLEAKETWYTRQNNRGLMIDGYNKVYVLSLHAKNRNDLDSKVAKRFFKSFRLLNKQN